MTETKEKYIPSIEKGWEIKDRTYVLTHGRSPLTWKIITKHSTRKPLMWFDEDAGENLELRYATNQNSVFVREQTGTSTLGHVVFEDGSLHVSRNNQALQKLLSLYHPKAGIDWEEINHEAQAQDVVEFVELELDALNLVTELEEDHLIAILRTEYGSKVSGYTPSQIKRLGFALAKKNPSLFIDLANDPDTKLRNFANMAVELGIVKLANNNTEFQWASNGRKLFTVPFDEHPYSSFARYFKTDEGAEVYTAISKKLKA